MMKKQGFAIAMASVLIGTSAHAAIQVASRDQEVQAPRGQTDVHAPRGQDAQPR
jgi:hypothetical protein